MSCTMTRTQELTASATGGQGARQVAQGLVVLGAAVCALAGCTSSQGVAAPVSIGSRHEAGVHVDHCSAPVRDHVQQQAELVGHSACAGSSGRRGPSGGHQRPLEQEAQRRCRSMAPESSCRRATSHWDRPEPRSRPFGPPFTAALVIARQPWRRTASAGPRPAWPSTAQRRHQRSRLATRAARCAGAGRHDRGASGNGPALDARIHAQRPGCRGLRLDPRSRRRPRPLTRPPSQRCPCVTMQFRSVPTVRRSCPRPADPTARYRSSTGSFPSCVENDTGSFRCAGP